MKQLKTVFALMFLSVMAIGMTSCEKDEPGAYSSHDYYYATVYDDPEYYWVIDMDNNSGSGYDGSFVIQAWSLDGKKMSNKNSYSGKYEYGNNNNRIFITWDHQSMSTMWEFSSYGIEMIGSSNPEELAYYTFYEGVPEFEEE